MNLDDAREELVRARAQALQEARAVGTSLADAFVCMGKIKGLDLAISILDKAGGNSARRED